MVTTYKLKLKGKKPKKPCKYGALANPVGRKRCKQKPKRACKYGSLKNPVGRKRCMKKPKKAKTCKYGRVVTAKGIRCKKRGYVSKPKKYRACKYGTNPPGTYTRTGKLKPRCKRKPRAKSTRKKKGTLKVLLNVPKKLVKGVTSALR